MSNSGFHKYSDNLFFSRRLLSSEAYMTLKDASIKVLNFFYMKRQFAKVNTPKGKKYVQTNNGDLVFTRKEALDLGFTSPRFTKAIDGLINAGFLSITHQGGGMAQDNSTYKLINEWEKFGTAEFKITPRQKGTCINESYKENFKDK